jgi:hypothetical protein
VNVFQGGCNRNSSAEKELSAKIHVVEYAQNVAGFSKNI